MIWREWLASDMRHYQVPCHGCGHMQALVWANVRWDKTLEGRHLPKTAHYVCESCGVAWTDADRHDAVAKGEWVASNSDAAGVAGFHIPGLLSPWVALADIVQESLMSKNDPALLQLWTNTVLGEPFEPAQETVEGSSLLQRGENYGPQSVPDAVKLLTAGVDVQGDRIEVQIMGFGAFEETWAVRYEVVPGHPAQRQVWDLLVCCWNPAAPTPAANCACASSVSTVAATTNYQDRAAWPGSCATSCARFAIVYPPVYPAQLRYRFSVSSFGICI